MILDYEKMHKRLIEGIRKSKCIKSRTRSYSRNSGSKGCGDVHMYKLLSHLKKILKFVNYDLRKATKAQKQ